MFQSFKARLYLIALLGALMLLSVPNSVHAASFSVDTTTLLDTTANMFNGLWPIFAVVIGIPFAIAIIKFIATSLRSAF